MAGTGGSHSTFLGLWTRGTESLPLHHYLPGKKQAKKIPQSCPPLAKKKILGNKIQRHLFILFFSVIILKMKNS